MQVGIDSWNSLDGCDVGDWWLLVAFAKENHLNQTVIFGFHVSCQGVRGVIAVNILDVSKNMGTAKS